MHGDVKAGTGATAVGQLAGDLHVHHPALRPPVPIPRQLGSAPAEFVGRADQLAALDRILTTIGGAPAGDRGDGAGVTAVISAIGGTGGIGKTWLALTWAHRNLHRFPDGQLSVDLRGFSPGEPRHPVDVLADFLAALGVDRDHQPTDLDARIALYRTRTTGKRMLILLDNAAAPEHVESLLPGGSTCTVLITSRNRLRGLIARHGASPVRVDVLTNTEARTLLTTALEDAHAHVTADAEQAITELIGLCGGFPLALGLIAARIRTDPDLLDDIATEMRDLGLDALDSDDLTASLPTVLSWSLRHLTDTQRILFGLLGIAPGPDIGLPAAVSLAGLPKSQVRTALRALEEASLVDRKPGGRYSMHDLLRAFAVDTARHRQLAIEQDSPSERTAAMVRILDHYASIASLAAELILTRRSVAHSRGDSRSTRLSDYDQAIGWLDTEYPNLIASIQSAVDEGMDETVIELTCPMCRFFAIRGYTREWIASHVTALEAARRRGDSRSEADLLNSLGVACRRLGEFDQAIRHQRAALAVFREIGDLNGELDVLTNLGIAHRRLSDFPASVRVLEQALALYAPDNDMASQAHTIDNLGTVLQRLGRYEEAATQHRRSLDLARRAGDRSLEAMALTNLGIVHEKLENCDEARRSHEEALRLARQIGDRHVEGHAVSKLGVVLRRLGQRDAALDCQNRGLLLLDETGSRGDQCESLNDLARTFAAFGDTTQAVAFHKRALALACEINDRFEEARALHGLSDALGSGDSEYPIASALALFEQLGVPAPD